MRTAGCLFVGCLSLSSAPLLGRMEFFGEGRALAEKAAVIGTLFPGVGEVEGLEAWAVLVKAAVLVRVLLISLQVLRLDGKGAALMDVIGWVIVRGSFDMDIGIWTAPMSMRGSAETLEIIGLVSVGMAPDMAPVEETRSGLVEVVTASPIFGWKTEAGRAVSGMVDGFLFVSSDPKSSSTFAHS